MGDHHLGVAPSVSYEPVADLYEQSRGGYERAVPLAAAIAEWLRTDGPVLDIGAGTGIVAECLQRLGHRVVGADLSLAMLRRAVPRLSGHVVQGDAQFLPVRAGAVASVVFCWSLHHIGSVEAGLGEAARVGRPDARVVAVSGRNEAPPDEIRALLEPLEASHQTQVEEIRGGAATAGLRVLGESWFEQTYEQSPAQAAATIERREYASTWHLDEAGWARTAQPLVDALLSLPQPDRTRVRLQRHRVMAFSTP